MEEITTRITVSGSSDRFAHITWSNLKGKITTFTHDDLGEGTRRSWKLYDSRIKTGLILGVEYDPVSKSWAVFATPLIRVEGASHYTLPNWRIEIEQSQYHNSFRLAVHAPSRVQFSPLFDDDQNDYDEPDDNRVDPDDMFPPAWLR